MTVHRLIGSPLAAIIFLVTAGTVSAQTQKELLDELDRTIEEAESYVSAKELRIKTIENTLHSRGVSPERQYRIYGELLTVYGTAVDPDCHATLAQLRIGSNVKKIPQSILDDYRRSFRAKRGDAIDWPSVVLTNGTTDKETGQ